MKFTNEQILQYQKPLSESEQDKCKRAINMLKRALEPLGYKEEKRGINAQFMSRDNEKNVFDYWTRLKTDANRNMNDIVLMIQGSYANNTNVRTESDVDIAIILESTFSTKYREGISREDYGFTSSSYTSNQFKTDIENILIQSFGNDVERKNKSIKIKGNSGRVDTDAVPCMRYRDYSNDFEINEKNYIHGIKILSDDGEVIYNYPEVHIENGKNKNINSNYFFKKAVRIFKKIRYIMIENGIESAEKISSFQIECLVWNIPTKEFTKNYEDSLTMTKALIDYLCLNVEEIEKYYEVNNIKKLCKEPTDIIKIITFLKDLFSFFEMGE